MFWICEESEKNIISKMKLDWNTEGMRKGQYVDGVRRSMIKEDRTEEDAEDRDLKRRKISLGQIIPNVFKMSS